MAPWWMALSAWTARNRSRRLQTLLRRGEGGEGDTRVEALLGGLSLAGGGLAQCATTGRKDHWYVRCLCSCMPLCGNCSLAVCSPKTVLLLTITVSREICTPG